MNRLWVQLTLAFLLVVLVAVGAIAFLVNRTADTAFRQYITNSGMRASGSGIQQLIAYYEQEDGWDGVENLLAEGIYISGPGGMPMMGPWEQHPGGPGGPGRRLDVLLADANGKVVFDSADKARTRPLTAKEKSRALPIIGGDGEEPIGYLLLSFPGSRDRLGTLEQRFLDRMREALILGAVLAAGLGLILGLLLSRRLTAPLQHLAAAARAVASGDLNQHVKVEGSAEIAEVGQAFNEMTGALEEAETLRQNMVADVAHELRTPLSVVQGNLQAILDDVYKLDKSEISRIYDETRLLSRLVDDLRELALADAGQLHLNLQATDAAQVINMTVDNLALAAEAQEVELAMELPDSLPAVQADPDRLAQVLRNLLVNALHHTPPGGSVRVMATQTDDTMEIAVADTGEGIAPEDLPHVFDRFWRADRARARDARSTDGSGSGLGLSVAQSLVEAQGGCIWVESVPDKGSTFHFTLPLQT
jgi:two-component system OmpR family sensor kinase/two-component system sensor histidine kinase BaeS